MPTWLVPCQLFELEIVVVIPETEALRFEFGAEAY